MHISGIIFNIVHVCLYDINKCNKNKMITFSQEYRNTSMACNERIRYAK